MRPLLLLLASVALLLVTSPSLGEDARQARRDILQSSDFRVRVQMALVLGRTGGAGARESLERALSDSHPAVRTAAAAALAKLSDARAISALELQNAREADPKVTTELSRAIASLKLIRDRASLAHARLILKLGAMHDHSGLQGMDVSDALRRAAISGGKNLQNAVIAEPTDNDVLRHAQQRKLPVLLLDGSLMSVLQKESAGVLHVTAKVEFSIRRDQVLKAMLSGGATATDSAQALREPARLTRLRGEAIDGAVLSALRGAEASLVGTR